MSSFVISANVSVCEDMQVHCQQQKESRTDSAMIRLWCQPSRKSFLAPAVINRNALCTRVRHCHCRFGCILRLWLGHQILGFSLGTSQSMQEIQVFGRALRELSGWWERFHDRVACASLDRTHDSVVFSNANVPICAANRSVIGSTFIFIVDCRPSAHTAMNCTEQTAVPFVHHLHGDHGSSEMELHGLIQRQFKGTSQVQMTSIDAGTFHANLLQEQHVCIKCC